MHCQLFRTPIDKFLNATDCISAYKPIANKNNRFYDFGKNSWYNHTYCPFRSYHNFCLRIVILAIIVEKIRLKVKNANMNHININTFLNKNKSTNFHSDKNNECTRKRVQEDASVVHWNAITAAASGQF